MAQPTDYTTLEEGHYNTSRVTDRHTAAPNSPTLAPESSSVGGYQLRPKISLTPLGKKSPVCNSIADARATHAPQPFQNLKKDWIRLHWIRLQTVLEALYHLKTFKAC